VLRDPSMARLRESMGVSVTFASEADRALYGLPSAVQAVKHITERDNDREVTGMTLADLRAVDPALSTSGTPERFVPIGYKPLSRPFAAAGSGLWVVSASASDTGVFHANGVRAGGLMTGDLQVTMTGTTRAQVGTLTDIVDLQMVSLATAAVGVISLYDAAADGNVLAQIGIGQKAPHYFVVQLWPTPSAVTTYYVDATFRVVELDDTTDLSSLPDEFHDVLSAYGRMKEYEKMNDERLPLAASEYERGLKALRWAVNSGPVRYLGSPKAERARAGAWTEPIRGW
jgi:hypothetical protein